MYFLFYPYLGESIYPFMHFDFKMNLWQCSLWSTCLKFYVQILLGSEGSWERFYKIGVSFPFRFACLPGTNYMQFLFCKVGFSLYIIIFCSLYDCFLVLISIHLMSWNICYVHANWLCLCICSPASILSL